MPCLQGKQFAEERLSLTLVAESALHNLNQKLRNILTMVLCQQHAAERSAAVATKDSALQVTLALPVVIHAKVSVPRSARMQLSCSAQVPFSCMMTLCVQLCQYSKHAILTAT